MIGRLKDRRSSRPLVSCDVQVLGGLEFRVEGYLLRVEVAWGLWVLRNSGCAA